MNCRTANKHQKEGASNLRSRLALPVITVEIFQDGIILNISALYPSIVVTSQFSRSKLFKFCSFDYQREKNQNTLELLGNSQAADTKIKKAPT